MAEDQSICRITPIDGSSASKATCMTSSSDGG